MPLPNEPDRRQSFRIEDNALVEFVPPGQIGPDMSLAQCFAPSSQFELLSELQQIDQQLQIQLFKLTETDTVLAASLRLINRKIERLAQHLSESATPTAAEQPDVTSHTLRSSTEQPITLSEGGMSLRWHQSLAIGARCAVRLQLQPGSYAIQSLARVVYAHPEDSQGFRLGISFIDLGETQRDLIARHILEHQAQLRRKLREQLDLEP